MVKPMLFVLALAALAAVRAGAEPGRPDSAAWDRALHRYGHAGGLDYAGLKADRGDLDAFLASLAGVDLQRLTRDQRLAFWINAYNAVVADFVLARYPGLESVRKVDGFFDRFTRPVAGEPRTLNQIEEEARKLDPRVHFAVVCASASCPDLRGEAYDAERIDRQLEEQTASFLANRDKGLRYDAAANTLWLSSIFKWYAGDFTGGSTVVAYFFGRGKVVDWVLPHLGDRALADTLRGADPSVSYLDYDWSLNDRPQPAASPPGS
jgi:Protein of unknown function, DUF547